MPKTEAWSLSGCDTTITTTTMTTVLTLSVYLDTVVEEEVRKLVFQWRIGVQHLKEQSGAGHEEGDDPDTQ